MYSSGVFDHLMMLERTEAAGLQRAQQERVEELRATAATLRAKRDRIRAETAAIKVCKELLPTISVICVVTLLI